MERSPRAPERHQRVGRGHDLGDRVVEVIESTQEPQPPTLGLPRLVEVEEGSDQFRRAIGVDAAVLLLAAAAHGNHQRTTREVHVEFLGEGARHRLAADFLDEIAEARTEARRSQGQQPRMGDYRKIRGDLRRGPRGHDARDDRE